MAVFLALALITALLHTVLLAVADFVGSAIAYAITGLLCGLVLRTRLVGGVRRMLVVCFSTIAFPAAGVMSFYVLMSGGSRIELAGVSALLWGLVGLAATIPFLGPRWRLAAPLFGAACFAAASGLAIFVFYDGFVIWLFIGPAFACLGASVFDHLCASLGLVSPQEDFDRLRVSLEFRWR